MPVVNTWRIRGVKLTDGAQLALSALRLDNGAGRVDAGAAVTCSHAPSAGSVDAPQTGAGNCSWPRATVEQPGFFIQFVLPTAQDVWCARFAVAALSAAVESYDLQALVSGRWVSAWQGAVAAVAVNTLSVARAAAPVFDTDFAWKTLTEPVPSTSGFIGCLASADAGVLLCPAFGNSAAMVNLSRDRGLTWTTATGIPASSSGFGAGAISPDGSTLVVSPLNGSAAKLNLSKDGGLTWSQPAGPVAGSGGFHGGAISQDGSTILVPGFGSNTARLNLSTDGGATWSQLAAAVPGTSGFVYCAMSWSGQIMLAPGHGDSTAVINISRDKGVTWSQINNLWKGPMGYGECAMSSDGRVMVVLPFGAAADAPFVLISSDYGVNWSTVRPVASGSSWGVCSVLPDGSRIMIASYNGITGGAIYVTADLGATWVQQSGLTSATSCFNGGFIRPGVIAVSERGSASARMSILQLKDTTYTASTLEARVALALRTTSDQSLLAQGLGGMYRQTSRQAMDVEFSGNGRIYGKVTEKDGNRALKRRVRLHRSRDGLLARETWSKADGTYSFEAINERYEYDVEAWDHEKNYYSAVANNQLPEAV